MDTPEEEKATSQRERVRDRAPRFDGVINLGHILTAFTVRYNGMPDNGGPQ